MRPGGLPCARVCLRNRRRERGTGRIRQAFPIGLRLVRTRRRLRNCTARVLLEAETLKDDVHMHVKILRRKDTGTVLLVYPSTIRRRSTNIARHWRLSAAGPARRPVATAWPWAGRNPARHRAATAGDEDVTFTLVARTPRATPAESAPRAETY